MHIKYRPQGERQTVETSNTVSGHLTPAFFETSVSAVLSMTESVSVELQFDRLTTCQCKFRG